MRTLEQVYQRAIEKGGPDDKFAQDIKQQMEDLKKQEEHRRFVLDSVSRRKAKNWLQRLLNKFGEPA